MLLGVLATLVALASGSQATAQPPKPDKKQEKARLVDREMFDRITLDAANKNAVIEVLPLDFPNRQVPKNPKPSDKMIVRLVGRAAQQYELNWGNVAKVELYEDMLVEEAGRLTAAKRYEEAFEYLDSVYRRDPKYPGLRDAIQMLLYLNAGAYFRQERYPEALSLLEELNRLNPDYKLPGQRGDLATAIGQLIDQIMDRYMAKQDFASARNMLVRVTNAYGERQKTTVDKWQSQIEGLATKHRNAARGFLVQQNYREALTAVNEMMNVWPTVPGGIELAKEMTERYPLVVVGVIQKTGHQDYDRIDDWSARRTGRLLQRKLCEYVGKGPEGGRYESPLGTIDSSDDGKQLTLALSMPPEGAPISVSGYDVARKLISLADPADPQYSSAWGGLMAGVAVNDVTQVRIDLRRRHVLPQALLQITLPAAAGNGATAGGPYRTAEQDAAETHYLVNTLYPFHQARQPKEIVERVYDKPEKAIKALKRGDIDVLERLYPADVFRLKNDSSLVVGQYAVPTVHVLVPNYKRPFTANRTFRRGLTVALNREGILYSELLGGSNLPGCVPLSAPLPAGIGSSDPIAYAYDERITPRTYNPRLGLTLISLAAKELAIAEAKKREAEQGGPAATDGQPEAKPEGKPDAKPVPLPEIKLEKLVLGHPPNDVARISCQSIAMQLEMLYLKVELLELTPDKLDDPDDKCDLVYKELVINEPVVDVPLMLGSRGLFEESSPYVGLALRRLEASKSWQDSSIALKDLHRILFDDITVIPLWQLTEYYAYRRWLRGVGDQIVTLYQIVEHWQVGLRSGSN